MQDSLKKKKSKKNNNNNKKQQTTHLACMMSLFHHAVYHMMETGWVKVSSTDVGPLHYQYQEEKKQGTTQTATDS